MIFYTGDVHRKIIAEGLTHTMEADLCTWDQQFHNTFGEQQNAPEEPEDMADGDKDSAPAIMQLDNAVPQPADKPPTIEAEAPQPVDKPSAIQAEAVEDGPQAARTRLLERVIKDSALTDQQKLEQIKELTLAWDRPTTVSSIKSNSRSSPPESVTRVSSMRAAALSLGLTK